MSSGRFNSAVGVCDGVCRECVECVDLVATNMRASFKLALYADGMIFQKLHFRSPFLFLYFSFLFFITCHALRYLFLFVPVSILAYSVSFFKKFIFPIYVLDSNYGNANLDFPQLRQHLGSGATFPSEKFHDRLISLR